MGQPERMSRNKEQRAIETHPSWARRISHSSGRSHQTNSMSLSLHHHLNLLSIFPFPMPGNPYNLPYSPVLR